MPRRASPPLPRRRGTHYSRSQAEACDPDPLRNDRVASASLGARGGPHPEARHRGQSRARRHEHRGMSPQQRFLLLLILVGALATVLGLVSKRARLLPYPVVLAAAGIAVGLLPGGQLPTLGGSVILLAFVPGLVFEAALTLELPELRKRLVPVGLLASVGVA